MKTASITSYDMKSPVLAKVIVATTGNPSADEFRQLIAEKFDMRAAPVENSFRELQPGVSVGFIRANREVRVVEKAELKASYRILSSNILMDNSDKTLWEIKSGAGGQYLTRQDTEDLSDLVEARVYHQRQNVPKLHQLTASRVNSNELVAFVTDTGSLDYGFVVRSNPERAQVLSSTTRTLAKVDNELIAGIYQVEIDKDTNKRIGVQLRANGLNPGQKLNAEQYYRALFDYSPEYMEEVIKMIEQGVTA